MLPGNTVQSRVSSQSQQHTLSDAACHMTNSATAHYLPKYLVFNIMVKCTNKLDFKKIRYLSSTLNSAQEGLM
jgi:hypothetical protein